MGLLDALTGNAYKDAAAQTQQYLTGVNNNINQGIADARQTGVNALTFGTQGATDALTGGINQARADINSLTPQALAFLTSMTGQSRDDLLKSQGDALGALKSGVGSATAAYAPLTRAATGFLQTGDQASQASADALGLNGPEGIKRAQATFQAGPGFQFAQEQGLEGILRNANAAGMATGGNQLLDAQKFGIGIGNQEFDKYRSALAAREGLYNPLGASTLGTAAGGVANAALTGGTGAANIITGTGSRLADLGSTTGARGADLISGQAKSLADLASRGGLAEASVLQTGGQNIADLLAKLQQQSSTAQTTIAPTFAKSYDTAAAGSTMGSANLLSLLQAGLTGFGGTSTGANLLSQLGLGKAA